ncbi:hypothetical protein C6P40_000466 [Pichia californica]|uniref:Uncharacterized protein n=1 Tax=Pichia californica TaxID=460514 RepID=A0A9P6WRH5_9ASCO|nr:hypothetical protein C6P42_001857 [[Candida] californica]KAG0690968.1 hypothetical protein C6P40_000466 [[Candida] californica]
MNSKCQIKKYKDKKIIKHAPLRPYIHTELDSTVYIKSNTPFISAIKRIEKLMKKFDEIPNKKGEMIRRGNMSKKTKYITVKGMGKSISKVLNIGLHFKYEEKFTIDIFTKTVGVLDEFVEEDDKKEENKDNNGEDEDDDLLRKRNVGAVEIRIYI